MKGSRLLTEELIGAMLSLMVMTAFVSLKMWPDAPFESAFLSRLNGFQFDCIQEFFESVVSVAFVMITRLLLPTTLDK
jgi:hypothetical protein